MQIGKLSNSQLKEMVLGRLKHFRPEVAVRPGVGMDFCALNLGEGFVVLSTDPITGASTNLAKMAVNVCCNDAAAAGAQPIGLLFTLLAPPSVTEQEIRSFAGELAQEAEKLNVEIIGGHTEITDAVTRLLPSATVVAFAKKIVSPSGMQPGDTLIMTKWAGLEGTTIIAHDMPGRLEGVLGGEELSAARALVDEISVLKEGLLAAEFGASAMHDATEGGVFGAAWELAQASGLELTLDETAIPVLDITKKICGALGLNPFRLISSGCMLIAAKDGEGLLKRLREAGVPAAAIGRAAKGSGVKLASGAVVEPPEADELYRLFEH